MLRASRNISKRASTLVPRINQAAVTNSRSCTNKSSAQEAVKQKDAPATPPPPPPPPPPRSGGGGLFWKLFGVSLAGAGGVVGFAWYDKNFKENVEAKIPYSKQAFNAVFQYLPPSPGSQKQPVTTKSSKPGSLAVDADEAKKLTLQSKKAPAAITDAEKSSKTESTVSKLESTKPTAAEIEAKRKEDERKKAAEKKRLEKEAAERKIQEQEMEAAAENAALENILTDNLREAQKFVQEAIDLQKSAAEATRDHTKQLRQAMDKQGEDVESQWEAATAAFTAKSDLLAKAEAATEDARLEIERVRASISEGKANKITKKNPTIRPTEQSLNSLNYDLKTAIGQNSKAQSEARVMSEYRDLVKKGRDQFRKEIQSITPDIPGISKSGGRLTEDELNALIAHAHRRIDQLQRQLAEAQALEQVRIDAALERQREEDDKLAEARVEVEREHMRGDFSVQKDKWDLDARVNFEIELRKELARQAAAHSEHLADVLRVQERDLKVAFDGVLSERVVEERESFQKEVAGWIARLKGIESAVEGRAEMEQQARKAQELWLACQMLQNVIKPPIDPSDSEDNDFVVSVPYEKQMKPLLDEFMAVLDAGNNHPFVNSVMESIPDEAVKRGVWTEKALTDRFPKVRKACRRTAMIDETGASFFRYILSHIQSLFVFSSTKPLTELDKVDTESLSTFVILDNAKFYVDQGDVEQALRFMNQLKGEPRRLADDWIKEARLFLETRQAANALLAHSSANGLGALL